MFCFMFHSPVGPTKTLFQQGINVFTDLSSQYNAAILDAVMSTMKRDQLFPGKRIKIRFFGITAVRMCFTKEQFSKTFACKVGYFLVIDQEFLLFVLKMRV